jgi:pilus assembly protein CpaE
MPVSDGTNGYTLGLVGAKGGVGTTVLTSSLAWALAQRGQRVVLLDLDVHSGQAALHLCERNAGPTVREAMGVIERMDETLLDTLLTPCSPALRLLPAPRQWWPQATEPSLEGSGLSKLVHTASALADWVLIDLPNGAMLHEGLSPLLQDLDEVMLVTEPTLPATFNARRAWQWLREHRAPTSTAGRPGIGLVLNKVQGSHTLPTEQVARTLGLDGTPAQWLEMPRSDATVARATYQGQAVGAVDAGDPLARAVSRWAADLAAHGSQAEPKTAAITPTHDHRPWHERLLRWAS